jgi:RNA polymerase sigma-70 factor (ECF subfamily)
VKSDDMLIEEIKNGNQASYDELMQKYQNHVYHIAYSFTRSPDDAMDLLQNIFLKAYENLKKFRKESQFKTWLMRITYNEGQNWIRKNKKKNLHDKIEFAHTSSAGLIPSHEDEYLVSENKALLLRCLYDLNTKYRLAVVLKYFESYSIKEIAEALNCSEGVVKNMLFRSLQKLRSKLKPIDVGVNP